MTTGTGVVLYVEDEEFDRFLMERAFAKADLETSLRMVNDGNAAIRYLSGEGEFADRRKYPLPAVVLLDLNLPEVHGFEVLKWIRKHHATLPVVVFTSSARDDDKVRAGTLGANDFVKKPGSGLKFVAVVQNLKEQWLSAPGPSSSDRGNSSAG